MFTLQLQHKDMPSEKLLYLPENLDPELANLLHTYRRIFCKPQGLPLNRTHNHTIPLIKDSTLVKVKHYRFPHSHNAQIEKMVKEMVDKGIIQPSTSPFSSPILLVWKEDGSWRFCMDYWALNAITVKDSFPMPIVDELLDELHGAQFFSILDLYLSIIRS